MMAPDTSYMMGKHGNGSPVALDIESGYSTTEIVWLLSMTETQAIDMDATPRDSCAHFTPDRLDTHATGDHDPLPVIARWADVQRARKLVVTRKQDLALLQMHASGYSERELAVLTCQSRMAVRRQWRASVDELLDILGRQNPVVKLGRVDACIACGQRPRVRLVDRQASVCVVCLTPSSRRLILPAPPRDHALFDTLVRNRWFERETAAGLALLHTPRVAYPVVSDEPHTLDSGLSLVGRGAPPVAVEGRQGDAYGAPPNPRTVNGSAAA